MSLTSKYGTVKTIMRKKETPTLGGLLTKLHTAHRHLMAIKFHYISSPPPDIIMAPLTMKNKTHIPKWLLRLTPTLEQYLDVAIIRDKRLIGNQIEPIYSLTVIGEHEQAVLAVHYIDTIFTTITRLVASKRKSLASNNKKVRKLNRMNGRSSYIVDAREEASQLKETVILGLLKTINSLLETAHEDYPVSYKNGQRRKDYIETQLKLKYTNSWRSGLSTRYG